MSTKLWELQSMPNSSFLRVLFIERKLIETQYWADLRNQHLSGELADEVFKIRYFAKIIQIREDERQSGRGQSYRRGVDWREPDPARFGRVEMARPAPDRYLSLEIQLPVKRLLLNCLSKFYLSSEAKKNFIDPLDLNTLLVQADWCAENDMEDVEAACRQLHSFLPQRDPAISSPKRLILKERKASTHPTLPKGP